MRKITCARALGIHLISHTLVYALCHAEYLVFMSRSLSPPHLEKMVGKLRQTNTTGADLDKSVRQIGNLPELDGYQEAVRYVYSLFDVPIDDSALTPTSSPP